MDLPPAGAWESQAFVVADRAAEAVPGGAVRARGAGARSPDAGDGEGDRGIHGCVWVKIAFRPVGAWLSLVEHSVRDRGVGGSNPLAPTNKIPKRPKQLALSSVRRWTDRPGAPLVSQPRLTVHARRDIFADGCRTRWPRIRGHSAHTRERKRADPPGCQRGSSVAEPSARWVFRYQCSSVRPSRSVYSHQEMVAACLSSRGPWRLSYYFEHYVGLIVLRRPASSKWMTMCWSSTSSTAGPARRSLGKTRIRLRSMRPLEIGVLFLDCLQTLWPALAAMEHRDDLQTLAAHSVRNDVRCAWHHELTSPGHPTGHARDSAVPPSDRPQRVMS